MGYLLDTHALIWYLSEPSFISEKVKQCITPDSVPVCFSVASVWEMAIKISNGKLRLDVSLEEFLSTATRTYRLEVLSITTRHALRVTSLPFHHRDPFDRMLAAQAMEDGLTIVSCDAILDQYGVNRIW